MISLGKALRPFVTEVCENFCPLQGSFCGPNSENEFRGLSGLGAHKAKRSRKNVNLKVVLKIAIVDISSFLTPLIFRCFSEFGPEGLK